MNLRAASTYDADEHIAEIYDTQETGLQGVALIRRLPAPAGALSILEPFCGTGCILMPLALDDHTVVGLDRSRAMLGRARRMRARWLADVSSRVTLCEVDVLSDPWQTGYDLVVLCGNCLYEPATVEDQAGVISQAAASLLPGGHLYLDDDHTDGRLDPAWRSSETESAFPVGTCADGTRLDSTRRVVWFDAAARLARFERTVSVTAPGGALTSTTFTEQKHAPSFAEMQAWIEAAGLRVEACYGDRDGSPCRPDAPRAIFWAAEA